MQAYCFALGLILSVAQVASTVMNLPTSVQSAFSQGRAPAIRREPSQPDVGGLVLRLRL